jgi:hypothetical protein
VPVIDLFHAAPDFNIRAAAYLLPAYVTSFLRARFLCVVDLGVGARRLLCSRPTGAKVGPDNGLFEMVARARMRLPRDPLAAAADVRQPTDATGCAGGARLARGDADSEPAGYFDRRSQSRHGAR